MELNKSPRVEQLIIGFTLFMAVTFFIAHEFVLSALFNIFVVDSQQRLDVLRVIISWFSVLVNSGLTLALVYLYYTMSEINKEQKEISERQVRLEEAQNKPYLFLEYFDFEDDQIRLKIKNEGKGPAKDFHIRCDAFALSSENDDHIQDLFKNERHGFELSSHEIKLVRADETSTNIRSTEILREEDDSTWYDSQYGLGWMSSENVSGGGMTSRSFSEIMSTLEDKMGHEEICVQITLIFSDITDELSAKKVDSMVVEIDSDQSIEQAIDRQHNKKGCNIGTEEILEDVNNERIISSH